MYKLLETIGFTRVSGSTEELQAANILKSVIETIGGKADITSFTVPSQEITNAKLIVTNHLGESKEYEVSAYGRCATTGPTGITKPFYYAEGFDDVAKTKIKDAIVLVNGYVNYDLYKKITESGAAGFISYNGSILDTDETGDLDMKEIREPMQIFGRIPGVNMRARNAIDLVRFEPKLATIIIEQEDTEISSHNVIAEIQGCRYPDEEIVFTAHYDSVLYSKGVYDNGAGSVIIMELYRYFMEHKPNRTMKFIWCGSEERGLLGSKAYVAGLTSEELAKIKLNVNVDVGGAVLGRDAVCAISEMSLVNMIEYLAKEIDFSVDVKQSIYSSDGIPFADKGIPAVNFMRFGPAGTAFIHDRHDTMLFLGAKSLELTASFVLAFTQKIDAAAVFLVPRSIPTNMVEEVDKYLKKTK